MAIKILLISTLIITFIEIIDGMNHTWEADDQDSFFLSHDASNRPPSPDEKMFQELYGTPVDQINEEIHGESSTAGAQNVPTEEKTREEWVQDIFLQEYQHLTDRVWDDLRNESYVQSWPILCYLLWDKKLEEKSGQECSAKGIYSPLFPYTYRVGIPKHKSYKVDVLKCKCPATSNLALRHQRISYSGLFFFISPCYMYPNSYYIMRQPRRALEVYDIRNTTFNPATEYNLSAQAYQTDEHTYGQPGCAASLNELKDVQMTEKKARDTFMNEYKYYTEGKMFWNDLRNKTYEHSWPELCLLLWDKEAHKKTGQICKSKQLSKFYNRKMPHGIVHISANNRMYADLLLCTCPKTIPFYVFKSCTIENTYYIMSRSGDKPRDLEVYDMRSVVFNPIPRNT